MKFLILIFSLFLVAFVSAKHFGEISASLCLKEESLTHVRHIHSNFSPKNTIFNNLLKIQ
jgi:hypothetical protein